MEQLEIIHEPRTCGTAFATISAPLEKAWRIAADFYELQKWVPSVRECYEIEEGVRFVKSFPSSDGTVTWVKEKMVTLDAENHSLSYKIVEGNMGLDNYDATLKLSRACQEGATLVNWSFWMNSSSRKPKHEQEQFLRWGIRKLEEAASSQELLQTRNTTCSSSKCSGEV